jgi:diguanylate cyclase (GGDEF)-like protein
MSNELLHQFALMGLESFLIAALLLAFFRFRRTLGMAPLHATLGVFYQLAAVMAGAFFVQLDEALMMSPASIVLFPATAFAVLFVYIKEDAREARRVIYGLLAANVVVGLLGLMVGQHLKSAVILNPHGLPAEFFAQQPRLLAVGTVALLADVGLIVLTYEFLGRYLKKFPFARIYLSTALVLIVDTVIFVTGGFGESSHYTSILTSAIQGKLAVALVYSIALAIYLETFDLHTDEATIGPHTDSGASIHSYRERYEALQRQSMRDPLTGLFHRGVFDTVVASQLALMTRSAKPLTLLMIDIDRFKEVNDLFGHREGDDVLRTVARAIHSESRSSDFPCRFGGEEFAVLLPETDPVSAFALAERIRNAVTLECRMRTVVGKARSITVSIGLASAPADATTAEMLVEIADRRLYESKNAGRDRTSTGMFAPLKVPPSEGTVV